MPNPPLRATRLTITGADTPNGDAEERLKRKYKVEATLNMSPETTKAGGITVHTFGGSRGSEMWVRVSQLGVGGFGDVYLETTKNKEKQRAVKKMTRGKVEWHYREIKEMIRVKRFKRQFVNFLCWYTEASGNIYIAMEYYPLGDLKAHVSAHGPLKEEVTKLVAKQILQGVFVLHESKIMHRDMKPEGLTNIENILVFSVDPISIRIADFGQAKLYEQSSNSNAGTHCWVAPEVTEMYYDEKCDLWSVGCVVYYLLTGLNPFVDYVDRNPCTATAMRGVPCPYTFWPRLHSLTFQDYIRSGNGNKHPGDQIILSGVSNNTNSFLKRLIIRNHRCRLSALQALSHPWICHTGSTPVQAAFEAGDVPLAGLLATHDPRFDGAWDLKSENDLSGVAQVILRIAARHGHKRLVTRALQYMPTEYEFQSVLEGWSFEPAIQGAAAYGSISIIERLLEELPAREKTYLTLLQACYAALQEGNPNVVEFLWPRLHLRDRVSDEGLSEKMARCDNLDLIKLAYDDWTKHNQPATNQLRTGVQGYPRSTYSILFPKLLANAARHGNNQLVEWLLSHPPAFPAPAPDLGSALIQAAEGGHRNITTILLRRYPLTLLTFTPPPPAFLHALNRAAFCGHYPIVIDLLSRGTVPTTETITQAAQGSNSSIVNLLICTLLETVQLDLVVTNFITPLVVPHLTATRLEWFSLHIRGFTPPGDLVKHVKSVSSLGALPELVWFLRNYRDQGNRSRLHYAAIIGAAEFGHANIIEYMYRLEQHPNIAEAWQLAAKGGHINVMELLFGNRKGPLGQVLGDALLEAATANHLGAVLWLLCHGAKLLMVGRAVERTGWVYSCEPVVQELLGDFGHGVFPPPLTFTSLAGIAGRRA